MKISHLLFTTALALQAAAPVLACELHKPKKPVQTELKQFGGLPHATPRPSPDAEVPLWSNLGSLTFKISTRNAMAQRYFDQGLMLAYGFNHAEARRSFQAAQRLDPTCAMCFWGEALVLGPNINAPMDPALNGAAIEAQARAASLASTASTREQALIKALAVRYSAEPGATRATLDQAYAEAMSTVARTFPDDQDIAAMTAEALMDLSPWDYWQSGGREPKGRTAEIVALLEGALKANPDHPGAIHFYIHAVEASDRPERAEPYADRLRALDLGAGHLVHMPSHIYYRVGRYADSLDVNRQAAQADEAFFGVVKPEGIYAGGYYPHNIHFLMVSAQMAGDGPTVIEAAEKLERAIPDDAARAMPGFVQPMKVAPLFAHAQFSAPETVLALPRPSADMPYVTALWTYARGVALAAKGDTEAARKAADEIAEIATKSDLSALSTAGVPAADVLAIARHVVLGRVAQAEGDGAGAVAAFEAAVALEDKLSYMEPPFWYYPVRQSLGAAYLEAGNTAAAEAIFRASLKSVPHNGWALFGLHEALARRGESAERAEVAERLGKAWAGTRDMLSLARL
jgi:tetratricopeptide (TPR) repeat protein